MVGHQIDTQIEGRLSVELVGGAVICVHVGFVWQICMRISFTNKVTVGLWQDNGSH